MFADILGLGAAEPVEEHPIWRDRAFSDPQPVFEPAELLASEGEEAPAAPAGVVMAPPVLLIPTPANPEEDTSSAAIGTVSEMSLSSPPVVFDDVLGESWPAGRVAGPSDPTVALSSFEDTAPPVVDWAEPSVADEPATGPDEGNG